MVWPDPPPWPGAEEQQPPSVTEPVLSMLEKLMTDLQVIKNQATASAHQIISPIVKAPTYSEDPTIRIPFKIVENLKARPQSSSPPSDPGPVPFGQSMQYTQPSPEQITSHATAYEPQELKWSASTSTPQPPYNAASEPTYRGPRPSIPYFSHQDPSVFARLQIARTGLLPPDCSELFKYQILVDHLKLEEARLVADSYLNSDSATPYSDTMTALNEKFGQPHQIALKRISSVMDSPDVRRGDTAALEKFSLQVRSLAGMLETLGPEGEAELKCGSHVARLLSKFP